MGLDGTAVMGIEMDGMGVECEGGVAEEEGRGRCQGVGECRFVWACIFDFPAFGLKRLFS